MLSVNAAYYHDYITIFLNRLEMYLIRTNSFIYFDLKQSETSSLKPFTANTHL